LDVIATRGATGESDFRSRLIKLIPRQVSRGHGERFDAVVWANEAAKVAWQVRGDMPEGALLIEELTEPSPQGSGAAGLFVMEKRGGRWRFVAVAPDGESIFDEKTTRCTVCHEQAPRDLVFSVPNAPPQLSTAQSSAATTAIAPSPVLSAAATKDARSAGSADLPSRR
jgi:hypothetical protein